MNDSAYDSSTFDYGSAASSSDSGVGLMLFAIIAIVLTIAIYVVNSIFLGMLFKKAGVEAWKAWVPIYNQWVFLELGGQKGWISLLYLLVMVPFVGSFLTIIPFVFSSIAAYRIGLNFGKDGVFVLLYILLTLVWTIWLAVDKTATWKPLGSAPESTATPNQPAAM